MRPAPGARQRLSPALFIIGVVLALAAVHQAQQAVRSHRETSARLIRDYGAFAAWSFRQHAGEALRRTFRATFTPVVHVAADGTPAGSVAASAWRARQAEAVGASACGSGCLPSYHFRFPLDAPDRVELAGDAPDTRTAAWIGSAVAAHAVTAARPAGDFATVRGRMDGRDRLLVYALVGTPGAGTVAYGFALDPERYAPLFAHVFSSEELLPRVVTGARANAELLGVQVRAPDGRVVFASSSDASWARQSSESLGAQLGGLVVSAAVLQSATDPLTGGTLPRARLPLIAGLLALSCALAVVAMYQMRRDAELARMRSDFVSSVSHELRTPLTQVQLFLETLRLGRHRTDAQREWIFENMQREVTRLTALVDNVLHFSRAERGVCGGAREATRLDQYLQAAIADFAPLASVRGVAIATRFEPGIITQLHRESFRQVILNLLDNAVKYGPKGQTVLVSTDIVDGRIRICVDDEGPGVEPRERETIFEPFRRGAQAVGGVAVGSGIGLSVVRELVEWHDGTVHVESGARGGARFVLALPGWREPTDTPELAAISHAGPQ